MPFILHNITLKDHTSSVTPPIVQLIWYIHNKQEIDISKIILDQIWEIVHSISKHPLAFQGLIT